MKTIPRVEANGKDNPNNNGNHGNNSISTRLRKHNSSFQRARTTAQRKMVSAAQSREVNMAIILICTVSMFLVCHLPRMLLVV